MFLIDNLGKLLAFEQLLIHIHIDCWVKLITASMNIVADNLCNSRSPKRNVRQSVLRLWEKVQRTQTKSCRSSGTRKVITTVPMYTSTVYTTNLKYTSCVGLHINTCDAWCTYYANCFIYARQSKVTTLRSWLKRQKFEITDSASDTQS